MNETGNGVWCEAERTGSLRTNLNFVLTNRLCSRCIGLFGVCFRFGGREAGCEARRNVSFSAKDKVRFRVEEHHRAHTYIAICAHTQRKYCEIVDNGTLEIRSIAIRRNSRLCNADVSNYSEIIKSTCAVRLVFEKSHTHMNDSIFIGHRCRRKGSSSTIN